MAMQCLNNGDTCFRYSKAYPETTAWGAPLARFSLIDFKFFPLLLASTLQVAAGNCFPNNVTIIMLPNNI